MGSTNVHQSCVQRVAISAPSVSSKEYLMTLNTSSCTALQAAPRWQACGGSPAGSSSSRFVPAF